MRPPRSSVMITIATSDAPPRTNPPISGNPSKRHGERREAQQEAAKNISQEPGDADHPGEEDVALGSHP